MPRGAYFIFASLLLANSGQGAYEDARVLPQGRSGVTAVHARSVAITNVYDPWGRENSVTAPYNKELNSKTLEKAVPEISSLISALNTQLPTYRYNPEKRDNGYFGITTDPNDEHLGDALSRGFLNVGAEAHQVQTVVGLQYGVTDQLTIGLMIPYLSNKVDVTHSITGLNTAEDIYRGVKDLKPSEPSKSAPIDELRKYVNDLQSANDETLQKMLQNKGYARFDSWNGSGFGDLVLGGRYLYLEQSRQSRVLRSSLQTALTAPTGRVHPPSQLTQMDFGHGCWDLGIANLLNYSPNAVLTLSNGLHYTKRFAGTRLMRVKRDAAEFIPDASDEEEVRMQLGDMASITLGGQLAVPQSWEALSFNAGYEWSWKGKDTFLGFRGDRDYTYLSDDTFEYTETVAVGATVSSVQHFIHSGGIPPGDLSLTFFIPTRGRNTPVARYAIAQLSLYF